MSPTDWQTSKKTDLPGPGIGDYIELEKILPPVYDPLLTPKETQQALFHLKRYIEDNLCKELSLMMVEVPLMVDAESGVNDMLDGDGSRTPIQFHISNDRDKHPIDAQVVQAATKWKRVALKQFDCRPGEGICTDVRAVRKDYFLDHDHSAYVDQLDWERVITAEQRNLEFLKSIVRKIWKVLVGAERFAQKMFPELRQPRYPNLPEELTSLRALRRIRIFRANAPTPSFCKNIPTYSSSASAGLCSMDILTRCAPPTTTTGLRKAHLGEVSVTVWPKVLKEMCAKKNIFVLEYSPSSFGNRVPQFARALCARSGASAAK